MKTSFFDRHNGHHEFRLIGWPNWKDIQKLYRLVERQGNKTCSSNDEPTAQQAIASESYAAATAARMFVNRSEKNSLNCLCLRDDYGTAHKSKARWSEWPKLLLLQYYINRSTLFGRWPGSLRMNKANEIKTLHSSSSVILYKNRRL